MISKWPILSEETVIILLGIMASFDSLAGWKRRPPQQNGQVKRQFFFAFRGLKLRTYDSALEQSYQNSSYLIRFWGILSNFLATYSLNVLLDDLNKPMIFRPQRFRIYPGTHFAHEDLDADQWQSENSHYKEELEFHFEKKMEHVDDVEQQWTDWKSVLSLCAWLAIRIFTTF